MDLRHSISLPLGVGHAPFMQLGQPTNKPVQLPEDAALRKIAEGIKSETGERFFSSLVRHLALVLNCQYASYPKYRKIGYVSARARCGVAGSSSRISTFRSREHPARQC